MLFSVKVSSFAPCRRIMQSCRDTADTRLVAARINDLHNTKWKVDVYIFYKYQNAKYSLNGVQFYDEILASVSLSTYGHRPTGFNKS
jgi:hypothetical protein